MTSKLESWRRAAYNAEECLTGCLASPEIAEHLDQATARAILEKLHQARIEMLAASEEATQPAAGEPVYQWAYGDLWVDCDGEEFSSSKAQGLAVRILWTAPPAAAHGDEAVRKWSWAEEHEAFKTWARSRITPLKLDLDEVGLFYDEVAGVAHDAWQARAAMRAQAGEGGE